MLNIYYTALRRHRITFGAILFPRKLGQESVARQQFQFFLRHLKMAASTSCVSEIPKFNGFCGSDSPRAGTRSRGSSLSIEHNELYRRELFALIRELRSHATSGLQFYGDSSDANGRRFYGAFVSLYDHVGRCGIEPSLEYILSVAHLYDLDPSVPGNGYRSVVTVVERCCRKLLMLVRHITSNRASYLFRGEHYGKR